MLLLSLLNLFTLACSCFIFGLDDGQSYELDLDITHAYYDAIQCNGTLTSVHMYAHSIGLIYLHLMLIEHGKVLVRNRISLKVIKPGIYASLLTSLQMHVDQRYVLIIYKLENHPSVLRYKLVDQVKGLHTQLPDTYISNGTVKSNQTLYDTRYFAVPSLSLEVTCCDESVPTQPNPINESTPKYTQEDETTVAQTITPKAENSCKMHNSVLFFVVIVAHLNACLIYFA